MDVFASNSVIELKNKLKEASSIILTGHRSPDGDAVGSCLALWNHLKEHGINSTVVMPDEFPAFLNWMNGREEIILHSQSPEKAEELLKNADILLSLDYNSVSRVGNLQQSFESSNAFKVMIDHHQMPEDFVDLTFSDDKSCSTLKWCSGYRKLGEEGSISSNTAGCLYCGIMTDTAHFDSLVTPKTQNCGSSTETGLTTVLFTDMFMTITEKAN